MKDFNELKIIHFRKAIKLYKNNSDFWEDLCHARRYELLKFKEFKYNKKVKILGCCGCDSCKILSNRIFTIDQALKDMPLPNPACNYKPNATEKGWCRCSYISADDPKTINEKIESNFRKELLKIISGNN